MTVQELYRFLEQKCPAALSAPWDNDGLSCAPDETRPVRRVLVTLDVTEAAVHRAVEGSFDVVLSHHPLIFRPVSALVPQDTVPRKLLALSRAGVAAMAFHTRFDAVKGGVNDVLAQLLGVKNAVPFGPAGETPCGRIGEISPTTVSDFAAMVKKKLQAPTVFAAGEGTVCRVALLGGEGSDYVDAARAEGADVFLTGRAGYHRMLDAAESGLAVVEAGHHYTERPALSRLAAWVSEADAAVAVEVFDSAVIRAI